MGGGPDEHAVTAQPSRMPAAAQVPGCLRCRTYGSLSVIGPITVTANVAIRFEAKDPVSLTIAHTRNVSAFDLATSAWCSRKCRSRKLESN